MTIRTHDAPPNSQADDSGEVDARTSSDTGTPTPGRLHAVVAAMGTTPAGQSLARTPPAAGTLTRVEGVAGSAASALLAWLHESHPRHVFVVVAEGPEPARRMEADLQSLLGSEVARLYPQGESRLYSDEEDPRINGLRIEAVEALLSGDSRLFVTTPRGLQERIELPDRLGQLRLDLATGEEIGFQLLVEELDTMGFRRSSLVQEVGQYSVRGGLVDIFSLGSPLPVRIEFWGDEITSIRHFDVSDQRSTETVEEVHLLPAALKHAMAGGEERTVRSLLEVLPSDAVLVRPGQGDPWSSLCMDLWDRATKIRDDRQEGGESLPGPERLLLPPEEAVSSLDRHPRIGFGSTTPPPDRTLGLDASTPPAMERKMERLVEFLDRESDRGAASIILCDNDGQVQRLEELLSEGGRARAGVQVGVGTVDAGFCLADSTPPLNVLTDHEIFRRSRRVRSGRQFRGAMALENLAQLSAGDYVVHMDHGIGRFQGLEQIEVAGEGLEVLAIEYSGGEILRVPIYRLDLVERWIGETDSADPPSIHRIGGKRWKTLRRKTQEAIDRMTQELLELYAEREMAHGFAFSPDTHWQREMEASFIYEDTPDQRRVSAEIKKDMESDKPMDRLICGDVGFGKTEVAIRAAFKAVQDGRQVAVLAPTTILVEQHGRTFAERLAEFPVRVETLSRFRTRGEQQAVIDGLVSGEVDIVVGTHRLLSKDVRFKTLGLLIVDEEQRFGVKHKERLKELRTSVDILTLTATPIPRTLQLSLSGVRNLSLIRTPPRDRLAVQTQTIQWSDVLLSEIIGRELDRGGQVYFLHNRVETIRSIAERDMRDAPGSRVDVSHGQMKAYEIDVSMRDFIQGETDILVCSSIVENGLDVPNANTLIVDRADHFGLSQLYQIRGRVGRSDRKAFCYLIVPDGVTEDARHRLQVLEHHTELGSGYEVALKDLELRGAGNLLGSNQSGFANAVGMDTYLRMLEDAVRRMQLGRERGDELFPEPEISLPGSAFLPDSYMADGSQKLHLYRRLSKLESREEVDDLRSELADRYGPLPTEAERLLEAHVLRLLGARLGIERVFVGDRKGRLNFRPAAQPRMADMEEPFRDRQLEVTVRRMVPLSLGLQQMGAEPMTRTLIRALEDWISGREEAA